MQKNRTVLFEQTYKIYLIDVITFLSIRKVERQKIVALMKFYKRVTLFFQLLMLFLICSIADVHDGYKKDRGAYLREEPKNPFSVNFKMIQFFMKGHEWYDGHGHV